MQEKKTVLTYAGLKDLEDELQELKVVRRKDVAEKIKEARGQGDLSENAEYDAAKEEQAEIEARIVQLEKMLRNAEVIDEEEIKTDSISLGGSVRLWDVEFEEEVKYLIVGSAEADPTNGKISNESPLGSALLGRKEGETVEVDAPDGIILYKVLEITTNNSNNSKNDTN
ncbi:MAG: transcription elongation factor GreA [Clostridiales bacterium]|jgi:transcription elongation factor GreA|nr:transcription elongation factor GreA [Clostridiales bacterium]